MKKYPIWIFTLLALMVVNVQIYQKEQTLKNGQTVLLELVPVDPRSLMQGDYMELRYALASHVKRDDLGNKGKVIVNIDQELQGIFVRLDDNTPLAAHEQRLIYRNRRGLRLGAESFFFQEGTSEIYDKAKYGELKVDKTGNSILVGLRDENGDRLEVN